MKAQDKNFWSLDRFGDEVREVLFRAPSPEEVQLIAGQCPFLELVRVVGKEDNTQNPELLDTGELGEPVMLPNEYGWIIQYWLGSLSGDTPAIISAGVAHAWPEPSFPERCSPDDDIDYTGKGTLVRQSFYVAGQMIALAVDHQWHALELMGGSEQMKWAAWCFAQTFGLECRGYEPTEEDRGKKKRIQELLDEIKANAQEVTLDLSPGFGTGKGGARTTRPEGEDQNS